MTSTQSRGTFICPSGDDVGMRPQHFEWHTKALEAKQDASLAYGDRRNVGLKSGKTSTDVLMNYNPYTDIGLDNGQMMYRADVFNQIPLVFTRLVCDWQLARELIHYGPFIHVNEVVCDYYWHGNNITIEENPLKIPFPVAENLHYIDPRYKVKIVEEAPKD